MTECVVRHPGLGTIRVLAARDGVVALYFEDHRRARITASRTISDPSTHTMLAWATRELSEYAAGTRASFTVPLAPAGTPFQQAVWRALRQIPYGETRAYAQIARAIGRPLAVRAVGAANALNPISVIVPCHRVVGSSGNLTGYAGGVARKQWLLEHETKHRTKLP